MKKTKKNKKIPDDRHPKYVVSASELAKWLWNDMPEEHYRANTEYLLEMGRVLRKDGVWMYPELGLSLVLEASADADGDAGKAQWSIKRKGEVSYGANYDGKTFYLILEEQLQDALEKDAMPDCVFEVEVDSPALGKIIAICSRELLLSGANPPYCVHEYCLARGLYGRENYPSPEKGS